MDGEVGKSLRNRLEESYDERLLLCEQGQHSECTYQKTFQTVQYVGTKEQSQYVLYVCRSSVVEPSL